jgi:hypothetical protein
MASEEAAIGLPTHRTIPDKAFRDAGEKCRVVFG